jgi:hypothetical protein
MSIWATAHGRASPLISGAVDPKLGAEMREQCERAVHLLIREAAK